MSSERIDWGQVFYPGPARPFSAAELKRAGGGRPSRTFVVMLAFNLAGPALLVLVLAPEGAMPRLAALLVGLGWPIWAGAMALWRQPTRARLLFASLAATAVFTLLVLALRWRMRAGEQLAFVGNVLTVLFAVCVLGYWLLVLFRAQQIDARLRELQERDRSVEMARRLASAQIQPHFVFNTLAALQHWVDSGDARASALLRSLGGYLQSVLPMFQRERLSLGEELQAVAHYLEVMQARLGTRFAFTVEADAAARAVALPPGLVLTLVENAVEHGAQRCLGDAELRVGARCEAGRLTVQVVDNGPGLPEVLTEGLGLSNSRARLAQAYGTRATLALQRRPEGGTLATLALPTT